MRLQAHSDAPAFLAAAESVLAADEARHNLVYGICSTLVDVPEAYPTAHLWTVADDAVVVEQREAKVARDVDAEHELQEAKGGQDGRQRNQPTNRARTPS